MDYDGFDYLIEERFPVEVVDAIKCLLDVNLYARSPRRGI